jgi:hypothetical protein
MRPFRVIVCGPADRARSINSLNFAFALATVHVSVFTALLSDLDVMIVMLVILEANIKKHGAQRI